MTKETTKEKKASVAEKIKFGDNNPLNSELASSEVSEEELKVGLLSSKNKESQKKTKKEERQNKRNKLRERRGGFSWLSNKDLSYEERARRNTRFLGEGMFVIFSIVLFYAFIIYIYLSSLNDYGISKGLVKARSMNKQITLCWAAIFVAIIFLTVGLIITIINTGEKTKKGKIILNRFDKIYNEIKILLIICFSVLLVPAFGFLTSWLDRGNQIVAQELKLELGKSGDMQRGLSFDIGGASLPPWVSLVFACMLSFIAMVLTIAIIESIARTIKARAYWEHSIVGRLWFHLYNSGKQNEWSLVLIMVTVLGSLFIANSLLGFAIVAICAIYYLPRWFFKYSEIKKGINEVKDGNFDYKIPLQGKGEFEKLASSVNEIADAQKKVMDKELKTEKLKSELISNVSHDLKTPLTSMVTYVDLLKREGLDSENASEYLEIIDEKTKRLETLTENLFDAAKASSGDIPVSIEKIDMKSILKQAMVELEDSLEKSQIEVLLTAPEDEVLVMADGKQLWRVLENLITNICKYAPKKSRAYFEISEKEETILLEVKNISRDQLNVTSAELLERFKRGDKSRNTAGSGLGLTIAKDLTHLMGGQFGIEIDGDLFKAMVTLKKPQDDEDENE